MTDTSMTIGIPCVNSLMFVQTAMTLIKTVAALPFPRNLAFVKNTYLHLARTEIVREARANHSSHLFYLDTDMDFENDVVLRLLAHDKDIIGANYNQRGFPLTTTVRVKNPEGLYTIADIPDTLFECDAVATGCMLIKMSVFDTIKEPWFFYKFDAKGNPIGEDVWFCEKAKEAGFKIWCDPTIKVGHIGEYRY